MSISHFNNTIRDYTITLSWRVNADIQMPSNLHSSPLFFLRPDRVLYSLKDD